MGALRRCFWTISDEMFCATAAVALIGFAIFADGIALFLVVLLHRRIDFLEDFRVCCVAIIIIGAITV